MQCWLALPSNLDRGPQGSGGYLATLAKRGLSEQAKGGNCISSRKSQTLSVVWLNHSRFMLSRNLVTLFCLICNIAFLIFASVTRLQLTPVQTRYGGGDRQLYQSTPPGVLPDFSLLLRPQHPTTPSHAKPTYAACQGERAYPCLSWQARGHVS